MYALEARVVRIMTGSLDECADQATILQGVIEEHQISWHPHVNGNITWWWLDPRHFDAFRPGGVINQTFDEWPNLDTSWLRAYGDDNDSLQRGLAYSVDSCIGLVEWGRRFSLEKRRAFEEGRRPTIHWPQSGKGDIRYDRLLMPVCLVRTTSVRSECIGTDYLLSSSASSFSESPRTSLVERVRHENPSSWTFPNPSRFDPVDSPTRQNGS
jgi:hypothetical protein